MNTVGADYIAPWPSWSHICHSSMKLEAQKSLLFPSSLICNAIAWPSPTTHLVSLNTNPLPLYLCQFVKDAMLFHAYTFNLLPVPWNPVSSTYLPASLICNSSATIACFWVLLLLSCLHQSWQSLLPVYRYLLCVGKHLGIVTNTILDDVYFIQKEFPRTCILSLPMPKSCHWWVECIVKITIHGIPS